MSSILVIDDSEINTMLIKSIFEEESEGITVYVELNSKNALNTIEQLMPSIILLDLMMPGVNGEEILQEIKKIPKLKDIPVVVVSAKQEQEDIDYVLSLGALDFIKKPISIDNLYLRIKNILETI